MVPTRSYIQYVLYALYRGSQYMPHYVAMASACSYLIRVRANWCTVLCVLVLCCVGPY